MLFSDFKKRTSKTNILSAVDVLGSFDFYTTLITLDSLTSQDVAELNKAFGAQPLITAFQQTNLTPDQYLIAKKIIPLAIHEYTHFLDSTSTLWGLKHLQLMSSAYLCSDNRGNNEKEFNRAKVFYDHSRRIGLPKYYTVVNRKAANTRPWLSNTSIGYLFSGSGIPTNRSVLFTKFYNANGEQLARSPISTVSLLEASAMAQEIQAQAILLKNTEPSFQLIERKQFDSDTLNYLYDPKITEYSVCAHMVADKLKCANGFTAFRICSILTRIILNLPDSAFDTLADICPIADLLGIAANHPFEKAVRNGLRNHDYGIAFYLLCVSLTPHSHQNNTKFQAELVEATIRLGLDPKTLTSDSNKAVEHLYNELAASDITSISIIAKAGFENYMSISPMSYALDFQKLHFPPVTLGDSSEVLLINLAHNTLRNFDINLCFKELFEGQAWVERFSEACV